MVSLILIHQAFGKESASFMGLTRIPRRMLFTAFQNVINKKQLFFEGVKGFDSS
jgi:hypothetical protein